MSMFDKLAYLEVTYKAWAPPEHSSTTSRPTYDRPQIVETVVTVQ